MRKRLLFAGAGVFAVAAAVAAILTSRDIGWRPGVTKANYDRIKIGMTLGQVEALMGMPPGEYNSIDPPLFRDADSEEGEDSVDQQGLRNERWWITDEALVIVGVDESGTVIYKSYSVGLLREPTILERLRGRLGL